MSCKVAYLVNQYPKVSHSFIRREIFALETLGIPVLRFSIRSCAGELVDEADQVELAKTRFILGVGILGLLRGLLQTVVQRPVSFLQALKLAFQVGWRSEAGLVLHLAYLAEACVLLGWLQQAEVTHLHAHFGTNSTTVAMLCQALGGPPYSFTVHGPEEFDKVNSIALPEKIQRAAFVVAISLFGRSQLYRWCAMEAWKKIHVVRCGVDAEFLAQPLVPLPEQPQLVCVGRLCEQKGQLLLLEAARQLKNEGRVFKLVLVGDGPLRPQIERLMTQYQLEDQVAITGWASAATVRQYLLDSRALVLPSFAEGLPVVIMEALALGRPVISTSVAGIVELVQSGRTGWVVSPGSVEELVSALRETLDAATATLEQLGQTGAAQVAAKHDAICEAQKLAQLFQTSQLQPEKLGEAVVPANDQFLTPSILP